MKRIKYFLLDIVLNLFDGGDGGGQGAGAAAPGADGDSGSQAGADTEHNSGGEANPNPTDARKAYKAFINDPANKPIHTQEINRIVGRHTRQNAALQGQIDGMRPIMDALAQRYGVADGDPAKLLAALDADKGYLAQAAEEAGMSVEQYSQLQKLQRENARLLQAEQERIGRQQAQEQLDAWNQEAEQLRERYPDFDLEAEAENDLFVRMLQSGVPMGNAYEVVHMDEIKQGLVKTTEKNVTDAIRARGMRPTENGAASGSGHTTTYDVNKLSKEQLNDIYQRVQRGENITFG